LRNRTRNPPFHTSGNVSDEKRIDPGRLTIDYRAGHRPEKDTIVITPADEALLRRAIAIAAQAVTLGDAPYGSLLADKDGTILIEEHNTVRRDNDISAHPELKLARWAARELDPAVAANTTMYTSCQPCGMCTGAIARSGLGRVVYALATEQLAELNPASGAWPVVPQDGPALFGEARLPIEAFYRP
jgi:tRNA(Arg) A34 adenosine deaminase TadA